MTIRTASIFALLAAASLASAQEPAPATVAAPGHFAGAVRAQSFGGAKDANRFSGNVDITHAASGRAGLYKVAMRLSTSGYGGNSSNMLMWSISPGRCGSQVQPLLPPSGLPPIEMRSGGAAELEWEGAIMLAENATYQLVIYDRGMNQQDIVACANLKYDAGKK